MTNPAQPRAAARERLLAWGTLLVVGLVVVWASLQIAHLRTRYSVSQFLPEKHPLIQADDRVRKQFFLDEVQPLLFTLTVTEGDWLSTARLKALERVTHTARDTKGVLSTLSLATIQGASQGGDDLSVGSLLNMTSEVERRAHVQADPVLTPNLISRDGKTTLLIASVTPDIDNKKLESAIAEIRSTLQDAFPSAQVDVGGVPAIQWQLAQLVKVELLRFMGLALLASCFTLLVVFSTASSAVVPLVIIFVSNVIVLASMTLAGQTLSVLAITIPILVSVNVLSLGTHTMLRLAEESSGFPVETDSSWSAKARLIGRTLRILFLPNLLTALTTSLGFATLALTSVPLIREFGVAVSTAMLLSWAVTTLLLFPLLVLMPLPKARAWAMKEAGWASWIFRERQTFVLAVLAAGLTMAVLGQRLDWTARLFDDLPSGEEARVTTERIDRDLGGMIPFEILVSEKGDSPWNDPASIRKLDQLLTGWRSRVEVGSALGLPDLLRQASGGAEAKLPTERRAVAESWFLISMSEDSPLKKYLTADGSTTRLGVRLRDLPSDRLKAAMQEMVAEVKGAFPTAEIQASGMATTVHALNNELSRDLMIGFWHALGVITFLLLVVFRSVKWAFAAMLPNLLPAAVLVGVLALTRTPIKPGVAIVFSIALGIAFDNTVYLLLRLRGILRDQAQQTLSMLDTRSAIQTALRLEGTPCLISSLCLLSGFAIFLLSEFGINRIFGSYMLVSLFFGLVGDLVFLPALVACWPRLLASRLEIEQAKLSPLGGAIPAPLVSSATVVNLRQEEVMSEERSESLPRIAAGLALIVSLGFAKDAGATPNALNADQILKRVEGRVASKDEAARIKMKVIESNGSSKERELEIKRKSGSKQQVLVRLEAPSDVRGVALLSVLKGGREDQWLYMPSQKKARRVVSGNRSQKFLDSEFNLEDFSAGTYIHFANKVIREEPGAGKSKIAVIESKAKGDETSYSRILTWIDLGSYQIQKSEYFDREGKLLKTMVFRDYKKFGQTWRAQTVEVRNMQNRRSTVLKVAGLKLNAGLPDSEFTQSALEDED